MMIIANIVAKKHIQIIQSIDSNIDMYKTSHFHYDINDFLFANFPQEEF
jgi:hypothetical protein